MKIVDLNLLIYAINSDAPLHDDARKWLERSLSGNETFGLTWVVILGFIRITTNPRIMPNPLSPETAMAVVEEWLDISTVRIVPPTERHWNIFKRIVKPLGTAGNLTTDAHLAALAVEHGATIYTTDNDFSRFQFLDWVNPMIG